MLGAAGETQAWLRREEEKKKSSLVRNEKISFPGGQALLGTQTWHPTLGEGRLASALTWHDLMARGGLPSWVLNSQPCTKGCLPSAECSLPGLAPVDQAESRRRDFPMTSTMPMLVTGICLGRVHPHTCRIKGSDPTSRP